MFGNPNISIDFSEHLKPSAACETESIVALFDIAPSTIAIALSTKVVHSARSQFFLNIVFILSEIPTVWLQ
ncbi:MAG: hypothetical protein EAZ28_02045, partial [Oscillatoriales cyanobacterium]